MEAIISFFMALIDFIANQIMTLIWAIQTIPQFVDFIFEFLAYCPSFLLFFMEASVALTVLFAVLKLR